MDVAGEQQLDVEHNLFKHRLDKNLKPVSSEAEKHGKYKVSVNLRPNSDGPSNYTENGRSCNRPGGNAHHQTAIGGAAI